MIVRDGEMRVLGCLVLPESITKNEGACDFTRKPLIYLVGMRGFEPGVVRRMVAASSIVKSIVTSFVFMLPNPRL